MRQVLAFLKFCIESPGDILIACEHGAHRSAGLALLLLLCLGYCDVGHTAACFEMTRYVIDCSAHTRQHVPQKERVDAMRHYLQEWVDERYPGLRGQKKRIGPIATGDFEKICQDVVPGALAAKAKKVSPRDTAQSAASTDLRAKRTSDPSTLLQTAEKKKPRAAAQAPAARRRVRSTDDVVVAVTAKALGLKVCHKAKAGAPPPGRQAAPVPRAAAHAAPQPPAHDDTLCALEAHTKMMKSFMQELKKQKEASDALAAERCDQARQLQQELDARTRELEEERRKAAWELDELETKRREAARELEEERQKARDAAHRVRTLEELMTIRDDTATVEVVCSMIMAERFEDGCMCRGRVHNE